MTESPAEVTPQTVSPYVDPALAPRYAGAGLVTYVQPFYNLQTDRMQGLEALARLRLADGRTESPAGFFADAQAAGQMRRIDLEILDGALAQTRAWRDSPDHPELVVSVNLSGDLVGDEPRR